MTFNQAEKYVHSFTRFGSQLGLDRMKILLNLLGNPHQKLKFVHVAGTNGKGTTVTMCASVLTQAGYKTGLYISPYVVDFRERFQIDGKMIPKDEFAALVEQIKPFIDEMAKEGNQVTEFEMITAIAFKYFYDSKCDVVCLEVGLGGRFDATNVIKTPLVSIITSISIDHTEILGDNVKLIAREKAGIIKESTDTVIYPLQNLDAQVVIMQRCADTNSRLIIPNYKNIKILESGAFGSKFEYNGKKYSIKMCGIHQIYNTVSVIEAMRIVAQKGYNITEATIAAGVGKAKLPARFEIMAKNPLIIVDGAHNREAVSSLCDAIVKLSEAPIIAVVGMMADKEVEFTAQSLAKCCKAIITVPVPTNSRAVSETELADIARKYCSEVYPMADYSKAVATAASLAGINGAVVVCGSFYLASDMRKAVKNYIKSN